MRKALLHCSYAAVLWWTPARGGSSQPITALCHWNQQGHGQGQHLHLHTHLHSPATLLTPGHVVPAYCCGLETQITKHRSAHHPWDQSPGTNRAHNQMQWSVLRPRRAREEYSAQTTPSLYHLSWMEGQDFESLERKTAICQAFTVWELSQPNAVAPQTRWNSKCLLLLVSLVFLYSSVMTWNTSKKKLSLFTCLLLN